MVFKKVELSVGQGVAGGGVHWTHLCLNELHGYIQSGKTTYGIEGLGEVKTLSGSLFASHLIDKWIATRLEKRQTAGHHEICYEEWKIYAYGLGWNEHQGTYRIKPQTNEHARLERISLYEKCRGECHNKIA